MKLIRTKEMALVLFLLMVITYFGCGKKGEISTSDITRKDSASATDSLPHPGELASDSSLTYEERQGKYAYDKYCAVCHGSEGKGDGFNAFNLDPKPRDFSDAKYVSSISDERLILTISGGGRAVNRSPLMPSWSGRLGKLEIRDVAAYLRTFSRKK